MQTSEEKAIHKEFELERIILFSDAVFAIAITLLIIEIKFPENADLKNLHGAALLITFKPVIIQFSTFIISFLIIGMYWFRHLQLCKYLKSYNNKVIFHNLLFLFFIVTFPFVVSGISHFGPRFHLPMHLYMINLFCLATAHYLFADYILYKNPQLSTHGNAEEKKYLTIQSKFLAIMIGCSLVVVLTVFFMFDVESPYVIASYQVITVFALIMSWRIKKYKPKKKKNVIIAQ